MIVLHMADSAEKFRMTQWAALVYAALSLGAVGFQLALVAGLPWGHLTMGGQFAGVLPPLLRVVAGASAVVLVLFAWGVLSAAGFRLWHQAPRWWGWVAVAYCVLGTVANAASPSAPERKLWTPVVAAMLLCSLLVALSRWPRQTD